MDLFCSPMKDTCLKFLTLLFRKNLLPLHPPTMAAALGSESWKNADDYEEGDETHPRATTSAANIDWNPLNSLASTMRDDTTCHLSPRFSPEHYNLVKRITFADGVSWVARLRLPELKSVFGSVRCWICGGGWGLRLRRRIISEQGHISRSQESSATTPIRVVILTVLTSS